MKLKQIGFSSFLCPKLLKSEISRPQAYLAYLALDFFTIDSQDQPSISQVVIWDTKSRCDAPWMPEMMSDEMTFYISATLECQNMSEEKQLEGRSTQSSSFLFSKSMAATLPSLTPGVFEKNKKNSWFRRDPDQFWSPTYGVAWMKIFRGALWESMRYRWSIFVNGYQMLSVINDLFNGLFNALFNAERSRLFDAKLASRWPLPHYHPHVGGVWLISWHVFKCG